MQIPGNGMIFLPDGQGLFSAMLLLKKISGRIVLIGDGEKRASDGKYMPCIKKMVQESESASRPMFIHGHLLVLPEYWPEKIQNQSNRRLCSVQ